MARIRKLPPEISNKIAAGEVVERPASVVKELCENCIDAGATRIDVELEDAGKALIRITDDGCGMDADDLALCMLEHATSKLDSADDLSYIDTMGFRGEALPSIGSVSHMRIVSRPRTPDGTPAADAYEITNHGGQLSFIKPASGAPGTVIEVANLFFNTPVRRRFLRQNSTEVARVMETLQHLALAWPEIGFSLTSDGRSVMKLAPNQTRRERIIDFSGKGLERDLIEINDFDEYAALTGFVGSVSQHRPNSRQMYLFVNRRSIRDRSLLQAIVLAFREFIPHGRYPVAWLFLELDPSEVDVNVHPTKIEVRFVQANRLFGKIKGALQEAVLRSGQLPRIALDQQRIEALKQIGRMDAAGRAAALRELAAPLQRAPVPARPSSTAIVEARPDGTDEPPLELATPGYDSPDITQDAPTLIQPRALEQARSYQSKAVPALRTSHAIRPSQPEASPPGLEDVFESDARPSPQSRQPGLLANTRGFFQIADTYIVVETTDGMVLIDQHAYHERILFWQLEHRLEAAPPEMQRLLVPEPLELSRIAAAMVHDHRELFRSFGFEIEPFGAGGWACFGLPRYLKTSKVAEFVATTLEELAASGRHKDPASLRKSMVEMTACKAAIKAGDSLSGQEIEALLREGESVPHTFSCPHGRPTTFRLSLSDLEKIFHRK